MKKYLILIVAFMIISSIWLIYSSLNKSPDMVEITISYQVELSNISGLYDIYIPCIVNVTYIDMYNIHMENATNLNKFEIIDGQCNITEKDSIYGHCINLKGTGNLTLLYQDSFELVYNPPEYIDPHFVLNLENGTIDDWSAETSYYIFMSPDNSSPDVSIQFIFDKNHGRSGWHTTISIDGSIEDGWNLIEASKETEMAD